VLRRRALLRSFALLALLASAAEAQETRCDRGDVEVRALSFQGNAAFSDAVLGQGIVTTASSRARRLLRFVGAKHCLNQEELPRDVLRLRLWYRNHGFVDATVDTIVAQVGRERVEVRFVIAEGEPVRVDTLRIEGLDAVPERSEIIAGLPTRVGGWFDRYANAATRDSLTRRLRDNGYPDAETFLGYDLRAADKLATVVLSVSPGARRRIGVVNITQEGRDGGAPEVRERAVRRLAGLEVGDLYQERALERAKRRLYQSEAFEQVVVEPAETLSDSLITVDVNVREGYLRAARLGGGWGTLDCFRMTGDLTEYNLFESATRLELRGRVSKIGIGEPLGGASELCPQARDDIYSTNLNYYAGATVSPPSLWRTRFVPTISLYSERRSEYNAFLRTTPAGGSVSLTEILPQRARSIGYTVEYGRTEAQPALYCAVFNACEADVRDALQRDLRLAVLSVSGSRERVDDPTDPRRGWVVRTETRHASRVVGADADINFSRVTLDGSAYVPIGTDIVFAARLRLGVVFGADGQTATFVPPQERLFAGGPTTVRGFRQNELGPQVYIPTAFDTLRVDGSPAPAVITANDTLVFRANPALVGERAVPTGGNSMIVGNAELRFASPFFSDLLRWTLFADVGELWNRGNAVAGLGFGSLKITPGLGLRLRTPIGFLRMDLAYNGYARSGGAAYFDAPIAAGGQLWCVSPRNSLPVTLENGQLSQASGNCPASFQPGVQRGLFGRWTPSFAIGQAF
jgi:outer membrane protein assembly complex protein YaeT